MDGHEIIKILQKHGWKILRTKGSHSRLGKKSKRATVPVHGKRDLGIGLVSSIEKQTGVKLK